MHEVTDGYYGKMQLMYDHTFKSGSQVMKNRWVSRAEGFQFYIYSTSIVPAPEQERNVNPETKDVSAHYLDSLWLLGMKMTASNLTRRDGNLSDTLKNLLMQKLKGLSVSLGGREESKVGYNGADI